MSYRQFAIRIPDKIRSERLMIPADPIANAIPSASDKNMKALFDLWYEFIEPYGTGDIGCPICVKGILENYRQMKPDLMKLEREYNIMKSAVK